MKRLKFKYTKDNGEQSFRDTIVLAEPRSQYHTVDITDLKDKERVLKDLSEIDKIRAGLLDSIKKYRNFKPEGMEIIE